MSPFKSQAQAKAAFSGALGPEMQGKADEWAHETPNLKDLPEHKGDSHAKQAIKGLKNAKPKDTKE